MKRVMVGVLLMMVVGVKVEAGKIAEVTVVGGSSAGRVPAYWWKYVEWHQQERRVMGGGYGTEE